MKSYLLRGAIINQIILFATIILKLITLRIFLYNWGLEIYGLFRLFADLSVYLGLVEMGVSSAAAYALYKPVEENNNAKIKNILITVQTIFTRIALLGFAVGMLMLVCLPFFIKSGSFQNIFYLYWLICFPPQIFGFLYAKYGLLYNADHKYNLMRLVQGGGQILAQAAALLVVYNSKSVILYLMANYVSVVFVYTSYLIVFKKYYPALNFRKDKNTYPEKELSGNIKLVFWHRIASAIVFNTDMIVISRFISLTASGWYGNYWFIVSSAQQIAFACLGGLNPYIGRLIAANSKTENYRHFRYLQAIYLGIALLGSFSVFFLGQHFITLWLGRKYLLSNMILLCLSVNLFISISRMNLETFKSNSGYYKDVYLPILEAILNIVLSIILVFYWGILGVIVGTIISNVLIVLIGKPLVVYPNCFNKSPLQGLLDQLWFLFLSTVAFGLVYLINSYLLWAPSNWLSFTGLTVSLLALQTIVVVAVLMLDTEIRDFLLSLLPKHRAN